MSQWIQCSLLRYTCVTMDTCTTMGTCTLFCYYIKMDFTVENGSKCGLCPKRLASKESLERHIRLKHRSDLEENTSPAKKQKLEIAEQLQENIDIDKLDIKKASDIDSDQEGGK